MGRYTVVVTGASGSVYGMRLTEQLVLGGHQVTVIMTDAGREVVAYELGFEQPLGTAESAAVALATFLELPSSEGLRVAYPSDLFDAVASGSHRVDGMFVAPASMGFCSSVAAGAAADLAERAADVCLKERVPLVLVARETPLSLVHLRNLTACAEAGAIVLPAMPAFYQRPESIDDLVSFVVGKALDAVGIDHSLFERWGHAEGVHP